MFVSPNRSSLRLLRRVVFRSSRPLSFAHHGRAFAAKDGSAEKDDQPLVMTEALFKKFDKDGDGVLDYSEFTKAFQPDKPKNDLSERKTYRKYSHPTYEMIERRPPPRRFSEFDDSILAVMASQGVHGAFKERMLREIMRADKCNYGDAYAVLGRMNTENEKVMSLYKLPFQIGIASTLAVGAAAIPMVFDRDVAMWFCEEFVKDDLPDPEEISTVFKVGTWTWSWMEPMIGTASFVLLALQLVRSHMQKIDVKPFGSYVESRRADHLTAKFPAYEREIVRDYAKSDPWGRDTNIARRGHPANSVIPNRSAGH